MSIDVGRLGPSVLSPAAGPKNAIHFVQLYENDGALVDAVRTFIGAGLESGGAAIVIATEAHRNVFEVALTASGLDLAELTHSGRYVSLDAKETLSSFMVDGMPSEDRFREVVGEIVARAGGHGEVRAFGEMVAVLWAEGNVTAVVALEEMWNRLAETYDFKLFCGYPVDGFDVDTLHSLRAVCNQHSHVIPPR